MKRTTEGYTIDHDNQAITITKAYANLSSKPGTKEYRELTKLHSSFPDYIIQRRTAKVSEDKKNHDGLTYDFMKKYIENVTNNNADKLKEFEDVKKLYKGMGSSYGKVKAWFLKKYPNYAEIAA